jgi:hypothetical protein
MTSIIHLLIERACQQAIHIKLTPANKNKDKPSLLRLVGCTLLILLEESKAKLR